MKTNVLNHYYPTKNKNFTRFVFSTLFFVFSLCCSAQNITQTQKHGFIPNQGQLTNTDGQLVPNIQYYTKGSMAWYFTKTGWHMVVAKRTGNHTPSVANAETDFDAALLVTDTLQMHRVDVRLKNARIDLTLTAEKPLAHYYNYYYGHCPDGITNVHPYETMTYKNVWDNIDIRFYIPQNTQGERSRTQVQGIEYDFVVHPGGNPNDIQLEYEGQEGLELTENQTALNIITPLGNIHETLPAIYQPTQSGLSECKLSEAPEPVLSGSVLSDVEVAEVACNPKPKTLNLISRKVGTGSNTLPGNYTLTPNAPHTYQVSFQVPHYNPDLALVIDPWATFVGGNDDDEATDVAIDTKDRINITGNTESANFPNSVGSFQTDKGVYNDIFIAAFEKTGQQRWTTYYGGSNYGNDFAHSIANDNQDNTIIGGYTNSSFVGGVYVNDFPTGADVPNGYVYTPMAPQSPTILSIPDDAFLLKFDENGQRLFGTLFGGDQADGITDVAIDANDNIIVTGLTRTDDIPSAVNTYPSTTSRSSAFVSVFASNGLASWTYYLGDASGETRGRSVTIDNADAIILTGLTEANGFSTDGTINQGDIDLFTARFTNTAAATIDWCTYFGGSEDESSLNTDGTGRQNDLHQVITDTFNQIYLMSVSKSDGIATPGSHQLNRVPGDGAPPHADEYDNILLSYTSTGNLRFATYLGGSDREGTNASGICIDNRGDILVTSSTLSNDIPTWPVGGYQINKNGTGESMYMAKFTNMGQLICGTYYGGDGVRVYDMEMDSKGFPVLAGSASANFPTSASPNPPNTVFQSNNAGSTDAFILKLCSPCGETADGALIADTSDVPVQYGDTIFMCLGDSTVLIPGIDLTNSRGLQLYKQHELFDTIIYRWTDLGTMTPVSGKPYKKFISTTGDSLWILPTVAGSINIQLEVAYGSCPVYKDITIEVISPPTATFTYLNDTILICQEDTAFLEIALTGEANWNMTICHYDYDTIAGAYDTLKINTNNIVANLIEIAVTDSGWHKICHIEDQDCDSIDQDSIYVQWRELPTLTLVNDTNLCGNDSVKLLKNFSGHGINNYEFKYTFKDQTTSISSDRTFNGTYTELVNYYATLGGTYTSIYLTDSLCSDSIVDVAKVFTYEKPFLEIKPKPANDTLTICEGTDVLIPLELTGLSPFTIYYEHVYYDATNILQIDPYNRTVITAASPETYNLAVSDSGWYKFYQLDDLYCDSIFRDSVYIDFYPTSTIDISTTDNDICLGESTSLVFALTGSGPFDVILTPNPPTVADLTGLNTGDRVNVTPAITTTYKTIDVTDANNCTATIEKEVTITVHTTEAGELDTNPMIVCETDNATVTETTPVTADDDDVVEYLLHDGTPYATDNAIHGRNFTGIFPLGGLTCGTTYYITRIAGNDDGTREVDENDPCFKQTSTVAVTWRCKPTLTFNANPNPICIGTCSDLTFAMTGDGPFDVAFAAPNNILNFTGINGHTINICPNASTNYEVISITDVHDCMASISESVSITVHDTLELISVVENCNGTNDKYTVTITLAGGVGPYFYVDNSIPAGTGPVMTAGGVFTAEFNSGDYFNIDFFDVNNCNIVNVNDKKDCDCDTDAGVMLDVTKQNLCEGQLTAPTHDGNQVLDANDVFSYALSRTVPPAALDIVVWSNTGIIGFDPSLMTCETTYYLLALAGNDSTSAGKVQFLDPCLNISNAIPVLWRTLPTASIDSANFALCDGDSVLVNILLDGCVSTLEYTLDNIVYPASTIHWLTAGNTYRLTNVAYSDAPACAQTINDSLHITAISSPTLVSKTEICNSNNDSVLVTIELTNGITPYQYIDNSIPLGENPTWATNSIFTIKFRSPAIYDLSFYDQNQCDTLPVTGTKNCNCATNAGDIDTTPLVICKSDNASITETLAAFTDADDVVEYLLHDGNPYLISSTIHDSNATGTFPLGALTCDSTYYITRIVGNDDGNGQVDVYDGCFKKTQTLPVTWRCTPDANFEDSDFSACIGTNINANVLLTPNNLALDYTISTPGINGVGEVGVDPQNFVMPAINVALNLTNVQYNSAPACAQTINKSLTITALDTLELLSVTETCNATNDKYVVTVTLSGGDIGSYQFDPATIPAVLAWTFDNIDTWTSEPINSGVAYEVDFFDGNNCDIEKVNGQKTCICSSNAGTMDTTSIDVCEDVNATAIYDGTGEFLDGNDMLQFILHDGVGFPDTTIGGVMDRNTLGVFAYVVSYAYNTTYYITAVVGNNVGGEVDLDDPCLNASARVPVVFRQLPDVTVTALPNDSICIGDVAELLFNFTKGIADYSVDAGINGAFTPLSNESSHTITPNLTETKTYTFTSVTDKHCTSIINQSVTFTLPPPFDVTSTITPVDCQDIDDGALSVEVTGGFGPYTYQWYDGNGDPISGEINNNIDSLAPGNYPVEITDSFGCTTTEYLSLATPPLFDIDLVAILEQICFQDSAGEVRIEAVGGRKYVIDDPLNLPEQNSNIFLQMNFIPGTNNYWIQAKDVNDCTADTIIDITGLTPMTWVSSPIDKYVCPNTAVELEGKVTGGNGGYSYYWNGNSTPQTILTVNPSVTTTYEVYAKDTNECPSAHEYVTVTVPDPMTLQTSPEITTICSGMSGTLSALASGGAGAYGYRWLDTTNLIPHAQPDWEITPDSTTIYEVIVKDTCGTNLSKTLKVVVPKEVDVAFTPKDQEGCAPLEITFTKTTSIDYQNLQWNFSDGPKSTKSNPTHTWYQAGTYPVTLTIFDAYGCAYQHDDTVYVHPNAVPLFTFLPEKINAALPEIQLRNHSQIADSFIWHIDSVGIFTEAEPKITFPAYESGVYQVCLLANNQYNCPDELCKRIYAEYENMVFVPNFFTPNGDQINEGFKPVLSSQAVTFYEFMIFDRWGEMLFSSDNNQQSWDGTFKNKPAKPDTYVWKLRVRFEGEIKIRKLLGSVTIGL